MELDSELVRRVYGGWLGKICGVIHGANTEGWSSEKIRSVFGEITEYPFHFRNFCADDDINGPMFFQRALLDYREPTSAQLAQTFLNYVSDGHGFFWWGGYGVSTEHTAYQNLLDGIPAGESGSAARNGTVLANQIGGQIFSDCWGFLNPGDPRTAADMAERMARLTHDENGLQGARFVAAAVAAAFAAPDVDAIFAQAYAQLSPESEYARMAADVHAFCTAHTDDWETALRYVQQRYGYQHYQGVCHILPNAAVMVLALHCGRGDYSRTVNIANMCGWDTDCNVGNAGAILGVFCGAEGIGAAWLAQVNDFVCASGALGSLNLQTVSQIAGVTLQIWCRRHGVTPPPEWQEVFGWPEGRYLHFLFPCATQALRADSADGLTVRMENVARPAPARPLHRALRLTVPAAENAQSFRLYFQSYYTPELFDDNRYCPDFAPVLYPGDEITVRWHFDEAEAGRLYTLRPFAENRLGGGWQAAPQPVRAGAGVQELHFRIPPADGWIVSRAGVEVLCADVAPRETKTSCRFYLDGVWVRGHAACGIRCAALPMEKWTAVDTCPAGFSYLRGILELDGHALNLSAGARVCEAYTGSRSWRSGRLEAELVPLLGGAHYVLARVQGTTRCYEIGLEPGLAVIRRRDGAEHALLASAPYVWRAGEPLTCRITLDGGCITAAVGSAPVLHAADAQPFADGCIGFAAGGGARTAVRYWRFDETPETEPALPEKETY